MNLSEIRIYIIEDRPIVAKTIKRALCSLEDETSGSKFDKKNITIKIIRKNLKEAHEIFNDTKVAVLEYDVLFIDLHLGSTVEQGLKLIRQYMHDPLICLIPKYIVTSEINSELVDNYKDVFHYTTILEKPKTANCESFKQLFEDESLVTALPKIVDIYRKINQNRSIDDIATMLNDLQRRSFFNHKETMTALNVINTLVKNIDFNVMDIQAKTVLIEQATLTMIRLLPEALPRESQAKAKKFITDNISMWIDSESDDFFPKTKQSFIKSFVDAINDVKADALKDSLKDGLKEIVKKVGEEQGITGDNLAWITAQLSYKGIASIYAFATMKV